MLINDDQVAFYRDLCAPFPSSEIKTRSQGGITLKYITARHVQNRLDSVCGPSNWQVSYEAIGGEGVCCTLSIFAPMNDGSHQWIAKSAIGGRAGMKEEDNDEKSGESDAFKRAGVAWGIARELYNAGVPEWNSGRAGKAQSQPAQEARQESPPPQQERATGGTYNSNNGGKPRKLPRPGKGPYAFLKQAETVFGVSLLDLAKKKAKAKRHPERTDDWDEQAIQEVLAPLVTWAKLQPWYAESGYFDDIPASELGEIDWSNN